MLQSAIARLARRPALFTRRYGTTNEHYNEPGGYLFNWVPGVKEPIDGAVKVYIIFYLGGLAAYAFLWQYRPDMSPEKMGREEALKRMRERGQDPESYRFTGSY